MQATFPMRTGDISYQIDLSPPATTGSWSVSLGFLDQNENSWSISGVSGKIYNNSGYMVGGYNSNTSTFLNGVISGSSHSIYQDDLLLSNAGKQEDNDYNFVDISGTYLGGYLPDVAILGKEVLNTSQNQTVPFWNKQNDDRVYFVTENANADMGFIRAISGMGFTFDTGALTGNNIDPDLLDAYYGLIIFGSATSSGLYSSAAWNTLSMPMMSLNSHLVCPENLGWYGSPYDPNFSVSNYSSGYQTGVVFPQQYRSPSNVPSFWAEFPIDGWMKVFDNDFNWFTSTHIYTPYVNQSDHYVKFVYSSPNTQVTMFDGTHYATHTFAGDVRPFDPYTPEEGLPNDLEIGFTDIEASWPYDVTVKMSNSLGGTGAPSLTWTGTPWGLDQVHLSGRVVPQRTSYNVDNLYRRTTLTSGLYPTDQFNMYTSDISVGHGYGGDTLVASLDSGKLVTVFHKGFGTGGPYISGSGYATNNLVVFSVTPTGNDWATGYNMWGTLTQTGKQLFVNAVAGFFID